MKDVFRICKNFIFKGAFSSTDPKILILNTGIMVQRVNLSNELTVIFFYYDTWAWRYHEPFPQFVPKLYCVLARTFLTMSWRFMIVFFSALRPFLLEVYLKTLRFDHEMVSNVGRKRSSSRFKIENITAATYSVTACYSRNTNKSSIHLGQLMTRPIKSFIHPFE